MNYIFKKYKENIINYDLLTKYYYKNILNIPKINNIKLFFNIKKYDLKKILTCLILLEILSLNKCRILKLKSSILSLKIRKGHPIGCSITLRKRKKQKFIALLANQAKELKYSTSLLPNGFTLNSEITNILILPEFENNYNIFKNIHSLKFSISTNAKSIDELNFLLKGYKLR